MLMKSISPSLIAALKSQFFEESALVGMSPSILYYMLFAKKQRLSQGYAVPNLVFTVFNRLIISLKSGE